MSSAPQSIDELDDRISEPSDTVEQCLAETSGDIMVIGAAGKMGFHLCRMLQRGLDNAGTRIVAVSRFGDPGSVAKFRDHGINVISADASQLDQLAALPDTANLFYLAGLKFGSASDPDRLQRFNVEMPRQVAERFRKARIVALSTGCVYAFSSPQSGGSTETSPLDPPGDYAASCIGRERAFVETSRVHGTAGVLVRLNYSVELRYGVLVDLAQMVLRGEKIDLTTGYFNLIWQGDAIDQIIRCLPLATSPPLAINITGPEIFSVRHLAQRFGERFGREPKFCGTEAETAWLANNEKAERLLGRPSVDIDTMIAWTAEWLERGGSTLGKPTLFQNREGNY